jgi:hypothetical protein
LSRRKAISEGYLYKGAAFVYDAVALPTEGDIAEMATTWSKTAHSFKNGLTK